MSRTARPRAYDPATHGRARIWSGVNAEARCQGVVDGYNGNPRRARGSFPTAEAAEVYRVAYLEYFRGQAGLFDAKGTQPPRPPSSTPAAASPEGDWIDPQGALFDSLPRTR